MEWVAVVGIMLMSYAVWDAGQQVRHDIKASRETLEEILTILRERLPDPDPPDTD